MVVVLIFVTACGIGSGPTSNSGEEEPYLENTGPNSSSNSSSSSVQRLKPLEEEISMFLGEEISLEVSSNKNEMLWGIIFPTEAEEIVVGSSQFIFCLEILGQYKISCEKISWTINVQEKPEDPIVDPPPPPPPTEGCTDPSAKNYNPNADLDNESCEYPISGCTNPEAANYNSEAEVDCGCCIIYGCTNKKATNYNPDATDNDGSCVFPPPPPPPPQKGLADTCWPMHDHDVRRSGTTNCTGATAATVKWQQTGKNLYDYSCVAIDETGIIYLAELDGVSSLNLQTGNQNWKFQQPGLSKFTGPCILKSGDIFVATTKVTSENHTGYLVRLDSSGNLKSQLTCQIATYLIDKDPEAFRACPPIILDDESYIFGTFNPTTYIGGCGYYSPEGIKIGRMSGNRGANGFATPACIEFSDKLPICYWLSQPEGWYGLSGEMLGDRPHTDADEDYYATQKFYSANYAKTQPRVFGNNIIIGTSHEVICYEYTGITSLKWSTSKNTTNFIIYQNQVIASGSTGLSSFSLSDGSSLWSSPNVANAIELVADNSNRIYALLKNQVVCFSSENGSILWSKDFSEATEHGTLAVFPGGLIAIRSDCGQIICFSD